MSVRVLVADERRLIAEVLAVTLDLVPEFDIIDVVEQSARIVPAVREQRPAGVVLGRVEEGDVDALGLAAEVREVAPTCGVAVIAVDLCRMEIARAVRDGLACSVVPGNARVAHLVHAIRGAITGCPTVDPALLQPPADDVGNLTERERDVLELTGRGLPTKQIAAELYLAQGTVRNLTSSAMRKVGARNRFEAARLATQHHLL